MNELIPLILSWQPAPKVIGDDVPSFSEWLTRFSETASGRTALQALMDVNKRALKNPESPFEELAVHCLVACYFAAHYNEQSDPGYLYRQQITEANKDRKDIARKFKALRQLLSRHKVLANWGFPDNYSLRVRDQPGNQSQIENVLGFLAGYETRIEGKLPEIDGGPFLYRFTFACLLFDQARTGKVVPTTSTALLFNLVLYFRKWTHYGTVVVQNGEPMPRENGRLVGLPCFRAAAALTGATLGKNISDRDANKLVSSLIGTGEVGLISWPN